MRMRSIAVLLSASVAISACGKKYEDFETGEFQGRLIVEWYDDDAFVYRPDPDDPLTFTRFDKTPFTPETFTTDGGSIPRPVRALKHYSPWGYAKAYIIHDWIFAEHRCGRLPEVDFQLSADILSEGIKTMIEDDAASTPTEHRVLETVDAVVRSEITKAIWNDGKCEDDVGFESGVERQDAPKAVFVIE